MGSIRGHFGPGLSLYIIGARWAVCIIIAYYKSITTDRHKKYQTSATFTSKFCYEGAIKLAQGLIGMACEFIFNVGDGRMYFIKGTQHMAMYFFLTLNGAVDILIFRGWPIPKYTDFCTFILAVFVEGMIFYFHISGRNAVDYHIHMLLIIAIAAVVVLTTFDACVGDRAIISLARAVSMMLHGSWMVQIGFILEPAYSHWDPNNHGDMMLLTDLFVGHIIMSIIVVILVASLIWLRYRKEWDPKKMNESTVEFQNVKHILF